VKTKHSKAAKEDVIAEMNEMNLTNNFEHRESKKGKKIVKFDLYYVSKVDFMEYYHQLKTENTRKLLANYARYIMDCIVPEEKPGIKVTYKMLL
jgi:hypothetical protein